jgi:prolipoprotein diacylglyceryl transferase
MSNLMQSTVAHASWSGSVLSSIPSPPFQELQIGPFAFRMYGLMIALGVLVAVWLGRRRWSSYGGDPEDITTVALVVVPAGLIGARLYHVITDWPDLYSGGRWWPNAFEIWKGGLGIPGAVLVGSFAGVAAARYLGLNWRTLADAAAPCIPLAQAIGRLGNWFNQELFGRPTSLPWGLEIDPAHRPTNALTATTFQPTFLYELLWNLALAGLILWGSSRTVLKRGRWMAFYVFGYGLGRLWVESLRDDFANRILGLRVNTWTAGLAVIGGLVWLFWGGSPIDREATERLRAGASMAEIMGAQPSVRSRGAAPPSTSADTDLPTDPQSADTQSADTQSTDSVADAASSTEPDGGAGADAASDPAPVDQE